MQYLEEIIVNKLIVDYFNKEFKRTKMMINLPVLS